MLKFERLQEQLRQGSQLTVRDVTKNETLVTRHQLSGRRVEVVLAGGLINWVKQRRQTDSGIQK